MIELTYWAAALWIWFLLSVGTGLGFILCAFMKTASDADDAMNRFTGDQIHHEHH